MWILAACAVSACSRQETGWTEASRKDSIAAYQRYLEQFPAGTHAADARARVVILQEDEAWTRANRLKTPEAWQRYLGEWPEGRYAAFARRQLVAFTPVNAAPVRDGFAVQLGAWSNEAAAQANLARFAREHARELAGLQLLVVSPQDPATDVWRLRTSPLAENAARELCEKLREAGVDCVPVVAGSAGQPPP
jgi:hypothetical protein